MLKYNINKSGHFSGKVSFVEGRFTVYRQENGLRFMWNALSKYSTGLCLPFVVLSVCYLTRASYGAILLIEEHSYYCGICKRKYMTERDALC